MTERNGSPRYHAEAAMRPSTLAGGLALLAMLLLSSPGVRLERVAALAATPAAAGLPVSPATR